MTKIPALLAAASAVALLLAASAEAAGPLITSGVTFVEGKDAEPPPWPASLPQRAPEGARPVSKISYTLPPAPQPKPAAEAGSGAPPPETQRVAAATLPPVNPSIVPVSARRSAEGARARPRRQAVAQDVSFGRTSTGVMVTIVWDR